MYGSGLTDPSSGVLLCLIDENGNSILQRIPASLGKDRSLMSEDRENLGLLNFQRSNIDEFIFEGPSLGKIAAVWIGLESGQWRFGNLSLTVFSRRQSPSVEADEEAGQLTGFQCDFDIGETLLGEGSDISMLELRPRLITDFSETGFGWLDVQTLNPSSPANQNISGDESMMEYANLKFSLFLYDALLILGGSSIASISSGERGALAFLTGGMGGLLYLFLLQRSVDGLPAPELLPSDRTENSDYILGKFKGPLSTIALGVVFAAIAAKFSSGELTGRVLTPNDLIFGMLGFLMCKVSVLLAAFNPMQIGTRDDN
ncbi:OLC1v1005955C2 [Oldenlandia corymbosa var. corymbosa]|nr:OLC1v1005955C2 [Oldenlandia corymbosa var. corymbosa]